MIGYRIFHYPITIIGNIILSMLLESLKCMWWQREKPIGTNKEKIQLHRLSIPILELLSHRFMICDIVTKCLLFCTCFFFQHRQKRIGFRFLWSTSYSNWYYYTTPPSPLLLFISYYNIDQHPAVFVENLVSKVC